MKLLYTIKIFELTLTKITVTLVHLSKNRNGISRLFTRISNERLGEAGADPTFHNIKCLMLREKGKGLIGRGMGGGGGGSDKIV